ncbi:hypothetical protein PYCCODRAFT_1432581 [Trametes coccinea BRFM310]|uniref:Uncharacterized protein n=1 Tax=Trametes coccinea (strain BRFM310) TaxID=1353009 RepID=A0A1Y2IZN4_TRAC3|nr:hypothetical protein PYCCODRAFT_1432581 [Trametes coccinea BRFM310]
MLCSPVRPPYNRENARPCDAIIRVSRTSLNGDEKGGLSCRVLRMLDLVVPVHMSRGPRHIAVSLTSLPLIDTHRQRARYGIALGVRKSPRGRARWKCAVTVEVLLPCKPARYGNSRLGRPVPMPTSQDALECGEVERTSDMRVTTIQSSVYGEQGKFPCGVVS